MKSRLNKQDELRIEQAYNEGCANLCVSMTNIPRIFEEGRRLIKEGCGDMELRVKLRQFVNGLK